MPTAPDLRWGLRPPQAPAPSLFPRDDAPAPPKSLVERHRPRTLAEIVGQPCAVRCLSEYVDAPYPHAWLFEGPTGTGKSSAALALAHDLRVHPTSGLWRIDSGQQDVEAMGHLLDEFRFVPMGWRLVMVEECDWMARAPKVANLWLSILDAIPARTTIVFTTNHPGKLDPRFVDRAERLTFESDPATLMPDMAELVARVWRAEGCQGPPPAPEATGAVQDGAVSFRRAVAGLEPLVRAARSRPAPVRADVRSFTRAADGSFRRAATA
jgi:DNA polymerase III subunit gamma/tau